MQADVVPIREFKTEQKTALIREALQSLKAAHRIDERTDDLDTERLVEWYEHTIPDVRDIKVLAGAMEIELAQRRGERIRQEGEQRGGDRGNQHTGGKVAQRTTLPKAERDQRRTDRALADQPAAVTDYVQTEAKAGRAPSKRGAVRAAKAATQPSAPKPKRVAAPGESDEMYTSAIRAEVRARIERVQGKPMTLEELARRWDVHTDIARRYFREAACEGDVVKDGDHFTVTQDPFKKRIHAEIMVRREEARDGYNKWRPDTIHTRLQSKLLDWIEDQVRS